MKRTLYIIILTGFFLLFNATCLRALEIVDSLDPDDVQIHVNIRNNLIQVNDIFTSQSLDQDILNLKWTPDTIRAKGDAVIDIPFTIGDGNKWGLFAQIDEKIWGTGDNVAFYRDAHNLDNIKGKLYDLRWRYENFNLVGFYKKYTFQQPAYQATIKNDFFACLGYEYHDIIGQGILDPASVTGKIKISGDYYKKRKKPDGSLGWGARIAWGVSVNPAPDIIMNFKVLNLPGFIYFPSLTTESNRVDNEQQTLSPIAITGFTTEQITFIELPAEIDCSLIFPITASGSLRFNAAYSAMFQDCSLEYSCKIKNGLLKLGICPTMYDVSVGFIWLKGKFELAFSPINMQITGIKVVVNL